MISVDPDTRRLIVITDEETGQYVSQVVSNLDRPKPQVLIKVVFLEVTHNDSLDLGVEGVYRNTYFANSSTGTFANIFGLSGLNQIVGGSNGPSANAFGQNLANYPQGVPGGLYQIMGSDYQATLHAIATAGKTEVLSRPSVLARNNQPATIVVGQSVPLITSTTYSALNNVPISTYSYTSVGIILRVTPFINSDNLVEMIVSPQISQLEDKSQWVQTAPGIFAPVIDSRSADTVVVTRDGQTVIIGGLMQKTKQHAETKIPFLGDIPLLGNLFKRRIQSNSKTELIIFLTPHIVMAPSQLAGLTANERAGQELPSKAFTEKELNQFLDNLPTKAGNTNTPAMTPDQEKKARTLLR